ncbi:ATPase, T2SS/T4P/T4SS family [Novipirellula artificiosorum]|uniref:Putative type II secretion system protein E n=1 Tax=Novipirellula artificiosorum TaxID=2528016 RepID=A0A5C6DF34_9BACT|nr:ATPase, T2SS/T4P/T4SS family [Novipirellula artificiosorum]TWU35853.1 putative type II secretion system protein E [Novipirellula artificiosorum]
MAQEPELQLWQTVAPVDFLPNIKDKTQSQSLLITSRQGAGYPIAGGQLAHAIQMRATHVLMDFSQAACALRYQIDGTWEQLPPLDRESGDAMLHAIKQLCLMNPADRRSSQTGKMGLKMGKDKFKLSIQSQGVPTGERVLAKIEAEKIPFSNLADLGMRDKMIASLKEQLNRPGNFVVISTPKSEGLTTTWSIAVDAADKFVRDYQSFEDQLKPEPEIINVSANFYGGDTKIEQLALLKRMILKEPDVLVFPELPENESMRISLEQAEKHSKSVLTRLNAPTAMEALSQLVAKYPESSKAIAKLTGGVLCQRLVRRLCDNCKVGFEPPPQLLKQLGIPAGRVAALYQPFVMPPIEEQVDANGKPAPITPCHVCNARGYMGRIAIFEWLKPGEKLRDAIIKTRDIGQLNAIAKAEGHRGIQAEAVLTVARGLTSLDELKRVFAKK